MSYKAIRIGLFQQKKFISLATKNLFNFLNKKKTTIKLTCKR